MGSPISLQTFKQQVQNVGDNAELRLRSSDDSLSTAKRGFGGRIVRFFKPSLDQADNRHVASQLLGGLKARYGDKIGVEAFRLARSDTRFDKSGGVYVNTNKPMTARQVKDVFVYARALERAALRETQATVAMKFAPDTGSRFGALANKVGVDPLTLTPTHKSYFTARLRDLVVNEAEVRGGFVKAGDIEKLAGKLLVHIASLGDDEIGEHAEAWKSMRDVGIGIAAGLAGHPDPQSDKPVDVGPALLEFLGRVDDLAVDILAGGATGGLGGDDIAKIRYVGIDNAIGKITPRYARELFMDAMKPDSPARLMLFGLGACTSHPEVSRDGPRSAATNDLISQTQEFLIRLGERGGVKNARAEVLKITDAGVGVTRAEITKGSYDKDKLTDAGITSGSKVGRTISQMLPIIGKHGIVLGEREKLAVELERLAMNEEFNLDSDKEKTGNTIDF